MSHCILNTHTLDIQTLNPPARRPPTTSNQSPSIIFGGAQHIFSRVHTLLGAFDTQELWSNVSAAGPKFVDHIFFYLHTAQSQMQVLFELSWYIVDTHITCVARWLWRVCVLCRLSTMLHMRWNYLNHNHIGYRDIGTRLFEVDSGLNA